MISDITILNGDCRTTLETIQSGTVRTCVTSPPYFGLRDYGNEAQIGLEFSPSDYVAELVSVFQSVRRVLSDDGTLWLNLGDSYSGYHGNSTVPDDDAPSNKPGYVENMRQSSVGTDGLKQKDLIGVPWMVAFALRADGWYLRRDIIWHKPNPMPESVTDRPTNSHEYLFLLSKNARYHYDHKAIAEPMTTTPVARDRASEGYNAAVGYPGGDRFSPGERTYGKDGMRNKRDVWTIPTKPFADAHFAVMPEALVEPCILAGSERGDVVLDPFAGSGTVGVVAVRHHRQFLGLELSEKYCGVIARRLHAIQPVLA